MCKFVIDCNIVASNVAGNSSCSCPKPCDQSIYSPVLSYAKLSTLKLGNTQPLLDQYYPALEARQRLEPEIFTSDITMYQKLLTHSTELTSYIEKYTSGSQSTLSRIWDCGTALLTEALAPDIKLQFDNIKSYSNAMQMAFGQSLEVHKNNAEVMYTKLDQLIVVIKIYLHGESENTTIMTLSQDASLIISIQHDLTKTLRDLMISPANLTLTHGISLEHLPQTFYRDQTSCEQSMMEYRFNLNYLKFELTIMYYQWPGVDYINEIQNRLTLVKMTGNVLLFCNINIILLYCMVSRLLIFFPIYLSLSLFFPLPLLFYYPFPFLFPFLLFPRLFFCLHFYFPFSLPFSFFFPFPNFLLHIFFTVSFNFPCSFLCLLYC